MPVELRIALRYLTARRKQAFISLISAISMLGVIVGVMALFIALGLMTGLQSEIREKILGSTAHVSVFRSGNEAIEEYAGVVARPAQGARRGRRGARGLRQGHRHGARRRGCAGHPQGRRPRRREDGDPGQHADGGGQLRSARREPDRSGAPSDSPGQRPRGAARTSASATWSRSLTPRGACRRWGFCRGREKFRVAGTVRSGLYEFDSAWAYIPLAVGPARLRPGDQAEPGRGPDRRHVSGEGDRGPESCRPWARATSRRTGSR